MMRIEILNGIDAVTAQAIAEFEDLRVELRKDATPQQIRETRRFENGLRRAIRELEFMRRLVQEDREVRS